MHMSHSWDTFSATCPVNVSCWTSKCLRGSWYEALVLSTLSTTILPVGIGTAHVCIESAHVNKVCSVTVM